MNIYGIKCSVCDLCFKITQTEVAKDIQYLNLILSKMSKGCPSCKGAIEIIPEIYGLTYEVTTLEQFWNASSEDIRGTASVEQLLIGSTIKSVEIQELDTGRCALKSMLLDSDKRVHLAVGQGWPVVHKVSEKGSE